jgi:glucose-6-phosphate isomerase
MLKKLVSFKNFQKKFLNDKDKKKILKFLNEILNENTQTIKSLSLDYKNSYKKDVLINFKKKFSNFKIIGMGGSILGTQAIYDFLKHKIKKTFFFINNLQNQKKMMKKNMQI